MMKNTEVLSTSSNLLHQVAEESIPNGSLEKKIGNEEITVPGVVKKKKLKERMKEYYQQNQMKINFVAVWVLYIIGILWIFGGFPLVSISTGELKCRGLFIDEKAIITNIANIAQYPYFDNKIDKLQSFQDRSIIQSINFMLCQDNELYRNLTNWIACSSLSSELLELELKSYSSPESHESILFTFAFPKEFPNSYRKEIFNFLLNVLQTHYSSRWAHKRLFFLFIETSDMNHDERLIRLLNEHYFPERFSNSSSSSSYHFHGNVRSSFIIDFRPFYNFPPGSSLVPPDKLFIQNFFLDYQGKYGQTPNLDVLSFTRQVYSHIITLEYSYELLEGGSHPFSSSSNLFLPDCVQRTREFLSIFGLQTIPFFANYETKVCTMLSHGIHSIRDTTRPLLGEKGEKNSLVGFWLEKNVDSVRFVPSPLDGNGLPGRRKVPRPGGSLKDLFFVTMGFSYMMNLLYEKLHHSYFLYLILSNKDFVGISEYAFAGLALISVLLCHFLHISVVSLRRSSSSSAAPTTSPTTTSSLVGLDIITLKMVASNLIVRWVILMASFYLFIIFAPTHFHEKSSLTMRFSLFLTTLTVDHFFLRSTWKINERKEEDRIYHVILNLTIMMMVLGMIASYQVSLFFLIMIILVPLVNLILSDFYEWKFIPIEIPWKAALVHCFHPLGVLSSYFCYLSWSQGSSSSWTQIIELQSEILSSEISILLLILCYSLSLLAE